MAQSLKCRPSELYGIEEQPTAFYFDRAISLFGMKVESELEKAESAGKTANSKTMKRNMVLVRYGLGGNFAKPR